MKKLLPFILLIASLSIFSQVPSYYNDVNLNLSGSALKSELATKIISTHHTNLSYTPGVWDALKLTDLDPNNASKVLLIYGYSDTDGNYVTDRTRSKDANGGTAGTQWNREHVYAKSLGTPDLGTSGPGADAHHLRAADISFNSQRSNKKFAAGSGNAGDVANGWYPGDEWKGDVARMMMYVYLRYGSQCLPTGVGTGATVASDSNMLQLFLDWNAQDPVSDFEKQRNPILEGIQGNRNPFIDNPAFATQIWGGPQAEDLFGNGGGGTTDMQAPTAPANLITSNITQTTVDLSWNASTDNTGVTGYEIYQGAVKIATTTSTNYSVSGLIANTAYSFTVKAFDAAGNVSVNSNTASTSTLAESTGGGNGIATDLFISEYVEGSSNNKALEIANFTGATVDLSSYSLKKASNGGGSFSSVLNLSGQLANGQVYVVANSSAITSVTSVANITDANVTAFNGNDAIALFKNNILIDLMGDANSSAYFGQDVTLQRKSSVTSPNTTYDANEWDVLSQDTFLGLGSHTVDGGTTPPADTTAPTAPSNMTAANITQTTVNLSWNASTDNVAVTGYDVYQGASKIATVTGTSYSVSGLTASTTYNFYINAFDAAGNFSSSSNTVNVTTLAEIDTTAPTAPSSLTVSNVTETSAVLAWNAATDNVGVTAYEVYQETTKIATVTTVTYTVINLTAATNYTFSVKAIDAAGNVSSSSNVIGVTTKSPAVTPDTILSQSYFETGWDNWTDGGSDCAYYSGSRSWEGSSSIQLRDNSGVASSMTSTTFDITPFDTVEVEFYFYANSMETGEDFWLRYYNGSTWQTVATYASGSDFNNDNFYVATVILNKNDYNFVSNAQFRFQADASANSDYIYIDQVTITGKTGVIAARGTKNSNSVTHLRYLNTDEFDTFEGDFKMYPNPVKGNVLTIKLHNDVEKVSYKIVSLIGQVIKEGMIDDDIIQLENINTGVYMLEINDGNEIMAQKFIKK